MYIITARYVVFHLEIHHTVDVKCSANAILCCQCEIKTDAFTFLIHIPGVIFISACYSKETKCSF